MIDNREVSNDNPICDKCPDVIDYIFKPAIPKPCENCYCPLDYYNRGNKMNESKWTEKRKSLCEEFWDDCAQEEPFCVNGLGVPCDRILEAEKEKMTVEELKLKLYKRYGIGKGSCASARKTKAIADYLGISTRLLSRILNKNETFGEMHKKILGLCSDAYYFDYATDTIIKADKHLSCPDGWEPEYQGMHGALRQSTSPL